ncbi:DUF2157 domain-containing protein [Porphyrobacter sp. CACIAM 03H1]|uniref:DUF2157 domain-containing protein n=1 Tax=Porphyrobacter sp. CACIAM 03H1 TaxID=2003315 RepID=UPI000B5A6568|nr:DUF2157 domain-containing protein [Porphyrobacter sp. CACIAM 03H1]ASJ90021.1 hypothetical protein CBR61_03115 [Porphyrobacter sp. CACIAM 03H1]
MSARKIAQWHDAGLIDAATRDRLTAYEADHARPLLLWAVWGIGALAIGLGLISVVAANWEDIPGLVRLSVHLALIAGLLGLLFAREDRLAAQSPWAVEALAFIAAALGLTFFGHLGQVYQTSSPLWQPLGLWLALFAPMLVLTGRSWPTAAALMGGAVWCAWDYATSRNGDPDLARQLWLATVLTAPVFFAPLGAWLQSRSAREDFWCDLEELAFTYAVGSASLATAIAAWDGFGDRNVAGEWASVLLAGALGALAGTGVIAARSGISGRMTGIVIIGAGATVPLAYLLSGQTVPAALAFFALWTGIAAAALAASWRVLFQIAVGLIAVRLIILSFELAADLLMSGFGLILAGVMILVVAWSAVRVSRRFAPRKGSAA